MALTYPQDKEALKPILCCCKECQGPATVCCDGFGAVTGAIDAVTTVLGDGFDHVYFSVQVAGGCLAKMPKARKSDDHGDDIEAAIPYEELGDGCCYNTWGNLFWYSLYGLLLHGITAAIFIVFMILSQASSHNDALLWFNFCLFVIVVSTIGIGLIVGDAGMKEEHLQNKLTSMRLELARSKRKLEAAERERGEE